MTSRRRVSNMPLQLLLPIDEEPADAQPQTEAGLLLYRPLLLYGRRSNGRSIKALTSTNKWS